MLLLILFYLLKLQTIFYVLENKMQLEEGFNDVRYKVSHIFKI